MGRWEGMRLLGVSPETLFSVQAVSPSARWAARNFPISHAQPSTQGEFSQIEAWFRKGIYLLHISLVIQ